MPPSKLFAVAVLVFLVVFPGSLNAEVTAIKAGRVVDPETGSVSANQVILVEGRLIKAIGADIAIPKDAPVIDLSKATVLPGLFDCHTHLCIAPVKPAGESPREFYGALLLSTVSNTTGYRAIHGVANARAMLESGFTTVRDVGNSGNYADTDLRRAIEEGVVPGPTVLNAGRIIAPMGGQFPSRIPPFFAELFGPSNDYIGVLNPERPGLGNPEYFFADTPEELRKAVRENVLYGARVIKLVVDDQMFVYSADDIRVVVEEARRANMRVCAHCMTDAGARNAAEAGVASIEHGFLVSDETLAVMKVNGVTLVGTDFTEEAGKAMGLPPGVHARVVDRIRRASAAGVPLAFGSDVFFAVPGKTIGDTALSFIDSAVLAGVSPTAILKQMITNPARLLGVENERGALKPGMAADIIAVSGNPIEDVNALKRVSFVMKEGRVIRP